MFWYYGYYTEFTDCSGVIKRLIYYTLSFKGGKDGNERIHMEITNNIPVEECAENEKFFFLKVNGSTLNILKENVRVEYNELYVFVK